MTVWTQNTQSQNTVEALILLRKRFQIMLKDWHDLKDKRVCVCVCVCVCTASVERYLCSKQGLKHPCSEMPKEASFSKNVIRCVRVSAWVNECVFGRMLFLEWVMPHRLQWFKLWAGMWEVHVFFLQNKPVWEHVCQR